MYLKIQDIAELLEVSENTIYKEIKESKIPVHKIGHQYRFNKEEINDWILKNRLNVSSKIIDLNVSKKPISLTDLIKKGGIFYNIRGNNIKEVISDAVNKINVPEEISKEEIISAFIQRENLGPTAIGNGIAIPHSRNPIITNAEDSCVSICFLEKELDYQSFDEKPIRMLFLVLSANAKRHLEILSKISYLCQKDSFISLLSINTEAEEIINFIANMELEWQKMRNVND